jgi:putative FmdB family regulatory protein
MPIYAYRCEACGHAQDVLQKFSDPLLTVCPVCGKEAYKKQVTAAGFQLKGSGWYVTDFRNNSSGAPPATGVPPVKSDSDSSAPASSSTGDSSSIGASKDKPTSSGSAPAASPAPSSSGDAKPSASPSPKPGSGTSST